MKRSNRKMAVGGLAFGPSPPVIPTEPLHSVIPSLPRNPFLYGSGQAPASGVIPLLVACFWLWISGFLNPALAQNKVSLDPLPLSGHKVILTIDDGHSSIYSNVYPLLKRYKMSATLALIVNSLNSNWSGYENSIGFLTYGQVKEMIDFCGVEVASHTLSHPWLTRLDSAKVWEEIYRSKVILESIFNVPVITFVYPYGDMDSRIVKMLRPAGYLLARSVRSGEVNFWVDPYRLPVFELRRETSLETVKSYILRNPVAILLLHRVVNEPKVFTEWSKDDFAELLNWLHKNGARCITLAELYYDWRQEVLRWIIREQKGRSNLYKPDVLFQEIDINATRTGHTP